jgi:FkbM family methyltransferase
MIKKVKRMLRAVGVEVTRYQPETSNAALLKKCLDFFNIDLVIDVGANIGQYGVVLREAGYKNQIISFEPMQDAFNQLKVTADRYNKQYNNWTVHHYGVGRANQEQIINVSKNSASSSILNVTHLSTDAEPLTVTDRQEKIKIVSLDSFFQNKLGEFKGIYLKVDVQGYEMHVLEGAKDLLRHIHVVQLEMSFVALYENGPLYKEIVSWMEAAGFEIYSILPDFRDMRSGRMLQADGIFINKNLTSKLFS